MRWLWIFSAAVLGALVGATLLNDPGYVLVRIGNWVFESSIAAGVLSVVLGLSLVAAILFGLRRAMQSLGLIKRWRTARRQDKSTVNRRHAMLSLARGDWVGAVQGLQRVSVESDHYLEALMIRLKQAVNTNDQSALSQLLVEARQLSVQESADFQLTLVRWLLEAGSVERARDQLKTLPQSTERAGLFAWCCIELRDWSTLFTHWPVVEKAGVLKAEGFRGQMTKFRAGQAMAEAEKGKQGSDAAWQVGLKNLPKQWRGDATTLGLFFDFLLDAGFSDSAREMLQDVLSKNWQPALVRRYGTLSNPQSLPKAIEVAQTWLHKHPEDSELLLALGRLNRSAHRQEASKNHLMAAAKAIRSPSARIDDAAELEQLVLIELGELKVLGAGT